MSRYVQEKYEWLYAERFKFKVLNDILVDHAVKCTLSRTVKHLLKEHKRALVSSEVSLSAVAQHAVDEMRYRLVGSYGCGQSPPNLQRCALEAWHICSEDNIMNRDAGPLPPVINSLIHRCDK